VDEPAAHLAQRSAEELARQAQDGDGPAFEALMARFHDALWQHLRRRCPRIEDAEDLRQDLLVQVWRKLDQYDPRRPFRAWVFAVAGNLAAGRARARGLADAPAPDGPERAALGPAPDRQAAELERADGLWAEAARVLSERQYRCLWLRYAQALSVADIAGRTRMSPTHVKVTLFRARRRLLRSGTAERWK
jgi:RNA polymerase sigma-70 factor (ECF subfamily)